MMEKCKNFEITSHQKLNFVEARFATWVTWASAPLRSAMLQASPRRHGGGNQGKSKMVSVETPVQTFPDLGRRFAYRAKTWFWFAKPMVASKSSLKSILRFFRVTCETTKIGALPATMGVAACGTNDRVSTWHTAISMPRLRRLLYHPRTIFCTKEIKQAFLISHCDWVRCKNSPPRPPCSFLLVSYLGIGRVMDTNRHLVGGWATPSSQESYITRYINIITKLWLKKTVCVNTGILLFVERDNQTSKSLKPQTKQCFAEKSIFWW